VTFLGAFVAACASEPPPPIEVHVVVVDEEKEPIKGAELVTPNGGILATTDARDRAVVLHAGRVGAASSIQVRCPVGFRSPSEPLVIRRMQAVVSVPPEYAAKCNHLRHKLVIAIRAEGGSDLPVLHLGREVARTDASGSAHVLVDGNVRDRVELVLSTAGPENSRLHPQNPSGVFDVAEHDDIAVFDVKFTRDAPPPLPRRIRRLGPRPM